jgi:hypothetical protein
LEQVFLDFLKRHSGHGFPGYQDQIHRPDEIMPMLTKRLSQETARTRPIHSAANPFRSDNTQPGCLTRSALLPIGYDAAASRPHPGCLDPGKMIRLPQP